MGNQIGSGSENPNDGKSSVPPAVSTLAGAGAGATAAVAGVIAGAAAETAGAAALTSGLAAVGALIGGGMLAGVFIVAAAPIAGGAAGYGVFRLYKKWASG